MGLHGDDLEASLKAPGIQTILNCSGLVSVHPRDSILPGGFGVAYHGLQKPHVGPSQVRGMRFPANRGP